jgi:hypothetical protein
MVGIRSPDGLVVGSCTNHLGVLGSVPKREEPVKTGRHPVLKYRIPHGSHILLPPRAQLCILYDSNKQQQLSGSGGPVRTEITAKTAV